MGNLMIDKLNEEVATFNEDRLRIELSEDFKEMVKGFQKDLINK